jgi:hypothetical protein
MTARGTKGVTRQVSDEEIVGWVVPDRLEEPEEAAERTAERIIEEHIKALKEIVSKLTLHA